MTAADLVAELESDGARLWEEGGRLRFRAPAGVMTPPRRDALAADRDAVLRHLRRRAGSGVPAGSAAERYEPFALTEVQTAYVLGRSAAFAYGGTPCHGYGELDLTGIDAGRVEQAWNRLVRRHDMLRAVVSPEGTQQVLAEVPPVAVPVVDLRGRPAAEVEQELAAIRAELDHRVHELGAWPMCELRVTTTDAGARLHLSIDFLICDLVSTQILFHELRTCAVDPDAELPPVTVTYRDVLEAERTGADGAVLDRARAYWDARGADLPGPPELPVLDERAGEPVRFHRHATALDPPRWERVRAEAGAHGVTASGAVLAAFAEVVARWSRQPRFCLNLTLQNRAEVDPGVALLVGDFTSVELLEVHHEPGRTFAERAGALQARLWEDLDHQAYSGLRVARDAARSHGGGTRMYPVVFTSGIGVAAGAGAGLGDVGYGITQTPQVWLDCQALETGGGLVVNWDVRCGVFPEGVVEAMFDAFTAVVEALADPAAWTSTSLVQRPADQVRRTAEVNRTAAPIGSALLHDGLVAAARRDPDRIAVTGPRGTLAFGDLLRRADVLAAALTRAGCRSGDLVGVLLEPGTDQITAVLAVLRAGGAYLPLDPGHPAQRHEQLLRDSGATAVIVPPGHAGVAGAPRVLPVSAADGEADPAWRPVRRDPGDLAYVIYTSGSTGMPKGVMITHRAAVNTLVDVGRRFRVGATDRVLALAGLGFDLSVFDIFCVPAAGGTLVVPDPARPGDPSHWAELVDTHGVTIWNSVPAQLQMLHDYLATEPGGGSRQGSLRLAMLSGDWIPVTLPDRIRGLLPGLEVVSLGGATEAAIWSVVRPIGAVDPEWVSIPYGAPLDNQTVAVVDEAFEECPDWVAGELVIGGSGVATGYLGDPARTADRFVRAPDGRVIYRTGDLARWRPDGELELLGRRDRQVKILGHRIELAEVESVLERVPGIGAAVAAVDGDDALSRRLVAVVTAATTAPPAGPARVPDGVLEIAAAACVEVTAGVDAGRHGRYWAGLNALALARMRAALAELDGDDAVLPRYRPLLHRWAEMTGTSAGSPATGPEALEDAVRATPPDVAPPAAVEYFVAALRALAEHLRGDADPLALLFPGGENVVADALYRDDVVSRGADRAVAALAAGLAAHVTDGPLRVLEVGAGTGNTTAAVLDALVGADPDQELDVLVSDVSPFFVGEARRRLAGRPAARHAVLDIERDPRAQGVEPNAFDLVVASDVLHGTTDVDAALRTLVELAAPGGHLLVVEMTRAEPAIAATLELLARTGDTPAGDGAAPRGATFLDEEGWARAFAAAGAEPAGCVGADDPVVGPRGLRIFVAQVKRDRARVRPDAVARAVAEKLPDHMVPVHLQVADALPLTPNGKVDHAGVLGLLPARRAEAPGGAQPATATEHAVAACWAEILGTATVPVDQGFLPLGGDSLLSARLAGRLRETVEGAGRRYFDDVLRHLLRGLTVRELAAEFDRAAEATDAADGSGAAVDGLPPWLVELGGSGDPLLLVHDGDGTLLPYEHLVGPLAEGNRVLGVLPADEEGYLDTPVARLIDEQADRAVAAVLDAELLTVRVVGAGAGSVLALEIARRLAETGAEVRGVVLLDPDHGGHPGALEQHTLLATAALGDSYYTGDVTIVTDDPGSPAAEQTRAAWLDRCLGEVTPAGPVDPATVCGLVDGLLR